MIKNNNESLLPEPGSFINVDVASHFCPQLLLNFTEMYPVEKWKTKGFFDGSALLDINCHWMTFEPLAPSVHLALVVIYTIVLLAVFLSNVLVIYIILW